MNSVKSLTALIISTMFTYSAMAAPLVDVGPKLPNAVLDIRYQTSYNFVGEPIDGYNAPKCLLTEAAAQALEAVQKEALQQGLTLKIFDCYRPQQAVDHFVRWTENRDVKMKHLFFPSVDKSELIEKGYIAEKSSHSRGSTVDLTLISLSPKFGGIGELDMGTKFDFFDPKSQTDSAEIDDQARQNRQLLKGLMEKHGFNNLPEEWWHYTLADEPYPDTYFDDPVE